LAREREESKAEWMVGGKRYGNVKHHMKKARVVGMQAQAEKILIETNQTKLKFLREHADVYKATHSEEYNKMVVDLLNKMMGSTNNGIGEMPVSAVSACSSQCSGDLEEDNNGETEEDD
jgi:hypothetical protein